MTDRRPQCRSSNNSDILDSHVQVQVTQHVRAVRTPLTATTSAAQTSLNRISRTASQLLGVIAQHSALISAMRELSMNGPELGYQSVSLPALVLFPFLSK
jgi:hypothetical protein